MEVDTQCTISERVAILPWRRIPCRVRFTRGWFISGMSGSWKSAITMMYGRKRRPATVSASCEDVSCVLSVAGERH